VSTIDIDIESVLSHGSKDTGVSAVRHVSATLFTVRGSEFVKGMHAKMVTDGFDCEYADAVIADTRGDRTIARKNVVATENIDRHMRLTTHVVQGVAWCARPLMIAYDDMNRMLRTATSTGVRSRCTE